MSENLQPKEKAGLYCEFIKLLLSVEKSLTEIDETGESFFSKNDIRLLDTCLEFLTNYAFIKGFEKSNQDLFAYIQAIQVEIVATKNVIGIFSDFNVLNQKTINNVTSACKKLENNGLKEILPMYKNFRSDLKTLFNEIHNELSQEVELLNNGRQTEDAIKSAKDKSESEKVKISPLQRLHENTQVYT